MNIFVIHFDRRFYDSHSFATTVWEEKNSDQSPMPFGLLVTISFQINNGDTLWVCVLRSSAIPIITHQLNSLWSGF